MEREKLDEINERLGNVIDSLPSSFYGSNGISKSLMYDLREISEIYEELKHLKVDS